MYTDKISRADCHKVCGSFSHCLFFLHISYMKPCHLLIRNIIISSCCSRAATFVYIVPPIVFRFTLPQGRCLSLISRPKTRACNSTCHHTCSPAALYSGQCCFVSRSRSNASHQTIWTRANNWTSKVSAISQPVRVSLCSHYLKCSTDLMHFMDLFHPFNRTITKCRKQNVLCSSGQIHCSCGRHSIKKKQLYVETPSCFGAKVSVVLVSRYVLNKD